MNNALATHQNSQSAVSRPGMHDGNVRRRTSKAEYELFLERQNFSFAKHKVFIVIPYSTYELLLSLVNCTKHGI
jgi:hypothetical protein